METETIIKIRGYHIDHFGHVNHARYIEFLEEARWAYMDTHNLIELFHRTGIVHVVADLFVTYKGSARAGDTVHIKTHLEKAGRVSFTMGQRIFVNSVLILDAGITNVFFDMNHHGAVEPSMALISGWPDLSVCLKKGGVKNEE